MSVPVFKRKEKGYALSINKPLPARPRPELHQRENMVKKALEFYEYLKEDPSRTYRHVSKHFGVSRARVSQLITLLKYLPSELIEKIRDCEDQDILTKFSGRKLLKIADRLFKDSLKC